MKYDIDEYEGVVRAIFVEQYNYLLKSDHALSEPIAILIDVAVEMEKMRPRFSNVGVSDSTSSFLITELISTFLCDTYDNYSESHSVELARAVIGRIAQKVKEHMDSVDSGNNDIEYAVFHPKYEN